jgi:hypothetical protein
MRVFTGHRRTGGEQRLGQELSAINAIEQAPGLRRHLETVVADRSQIQRLQKAI